MRIVLAGQVPAQKNNHVSWVNPKTGRVVNTTARHVQLWQQDVAKQLMQYRGQAEGKVSIAYTFHVKDNRRRDLDNMIASVNDALVKAGLLKDDSWQSLSIGAADAVLDKENPGVELWIGEDETPVTVGSSTQALDQA